MRGATLMELSNDWRGGDWKPAVRVGWGALVGRPDARTAETELNAR